MEDDPLSESSLFCNTVLVALTNKGFRENEEPVSLAFMNRHAMSPRKVLERGDDVFWIFPHGEVIYFSKQDDEDNEPAFYPLEKQEDCLYFIEHM